jgi:hypothetical protein
MIESIFGCFQQQTSQSPSCEERYEHHLMSIHNFQKRGQRTKADTLARSGAVRQGYCYPSGLFRLSGGNGTGAALKTLKTGSPAR